MIRSKFPGKQANRRERNYYFAGQCAPDDRIDQRQPQSIREIHSFILAKLTLAAPVRSVAAAAAPFRSVAKCTALAAPPG